MRGEHRSRRSRKKMRRKGGEAEEEKKSRICFPQWVCSFVGGLLYEPPGGNQVDGLPPVANCF